MAELHVIDKATGKSVTVIQAQLAGMNYEVTRQEWEDAAWKAAVDDGDVDASKRENYEIRIAPK